MECFVDGKKVEEFERAIEERGSMPMFAFLDLVGLKLLMATGYWRAPTGINNADRLKG